MRQIASNAGRSLRQLEPHLKFDIIPTPLDQSSQTVKTLRLLVFGIFLTGARPRAAAFARMGSLMLCHLVPLHPLMDAEFNAR